MENLEPALRFSHEFQKILNTHTMRSVALFLFLLAIGGNGDDKMTSIKSRDTKRFRRGKSIRSSRAQDLVNLLETESIDDVLEKVEVSLKKLADETSMKPQENHPCGCCVMMMPCACCASHGDSSGGVETTGTHSTPMAKPTYETKLEVSPQKPPTKPPAPSTQLESLPERFCSLPKRTYEDRIEGVQEVPICANVHEEEKLRVDMECLPNCDEGYVTEDTTPFVCVRGKESAENALQPPPLKLALTTKRDTFLETFTCVKKTCDAVEQTFEREFSK